MKKENQQPKQLVKPRDLALGIAALMAWGIVGVVPVVRAEDLPAPSTTVEEQVNSPPQEGDVQERGLLQGVIPGVPKGGTLTPGNRFNAPTPSLDLVANAIGLSSKSVTINLRVPANLPVTVPVEISVAYNSPAGIQRLTKTYSTGAGNTILYNEVEGTGQPRLMRLDISLRELSPGGKAFSFSWQFTLTPLYDVTISPLRFTLYSDCDLVGKSEVIFRWLSPDRQVHSIPKFSIHGQETKHIPEFAWFVKEVSTQRNFREPSMIFYEYDFLIGEFEPPIPAGERMLLPGKTQDFNFLLNETNAVPTTSIDLGKCQAVIKYNITQTLLKFPHL